MTWWAWMVVGVLLLGAELFAVDAQFYLIFIGLGAVVVGLIELVGPELPPWVPWILFAVLSLTSMFTVRRQMYERLRGRAIGIADSAKGSHVTIEQDVRPGQSCRTEYRGSVWTAINVGDESIPAGSTAEIEAVDGVKLNVRLLK
jgi:inner membrane protein